MSIYKYKYLYINIYTYNYIDKTWQKLTQVHTLFI